MRIGLRVKLLKIFMSRKLQRIFVVEFNMSLTQLISLHFGSHTCSQTTLTADCDGGPVGTGPLLSTPLTHLTSITSWSIFSFSSNSSWSFSALSLWTRLLISLAKFCSSSARSRWTLGKEQANNPYVTLQAE